MRDKDFYLPQVHFQVEALLGYPVLSALGRITFYNDRRFGVDTPSGLKVNAGSRMFMEQLTPVVAADDGVATRLFTLDTGATNTYLTAKYLSDHHVESAAAKKSTVRMTGHPHPVPAYYTEHVTLTLGGVVVHLKHIPVLAVPQGTGEDFSTATWDKMCSDDSAATRSIFVPCGFQPSVDSGKKICCCWTAQRA